MPTIHPPLTAERLRELLSYDPETGEFRWRVSRGGKAQPGTLAGTERTVNEGGATYRLIAVDGPEYGAHRLAWLYMTGEWPKDRVDHRDCDGLNNRWGNLREATQGQNLGNSRLSRRNKHGLKGVSFHKAAGKFRATIKHSGRGYHLGLFETAELAHAAYVAKATELYGEFARAS